MALLPNGMEVCTQPLVFEKTSTRGAASLQETDKAINGTRTEAAKSCLMVILSVALTEGQGSIDTLEISNYLMNIMV